MEKKLVVVTSSDSKFGDFLINHWLKSLLNNIDYQLVDIVILDYGLSDQQRNVLLSKKVKIYKCIRDNCVNNIRYRDMRNFLNENKNYEQILSCDGGDIIFQKNITELFFKNSEAFRVVTEDWTHQFFIKYSLKDLYDKNLKKEILDLSEKNKIINSGFIIGPRGQILELCSFMQQNLPKKNSYGIDQLIANLFIYKNGFIDLGRNFNFVLQASAKRFKIEKGIFLNEDNEPITVVHNSGYISFLRLIKNFGYGEEFNKVKPHIYPIIKISNKLF